MLLELVPLILPVAFVVVGLGLGGMGALQMRDAFSAGNTPVQDAAEVDTGYGKVEGRATERNGTVVAPFTGTECLAYEASLQNWNVNSSGAKTTTGWKSDHDVFECEPFWLTDATGDIAVDPTGAARGWGLDHEQEFPSTEAPTGPYAQFVDDHDIYTFDDEGISEGHRVRFVEKRIDIDDELAVFGPVDDSGAERTIRKTGGRLIKRPFAIADELSELVDPPSYGFVWVVFGLVFTVAGIWAGWNMLGLG